MRTYVSSLALLCFFLLPTHSQSQTITTIAGGITVNFGGDGAAATAAYMNDPAAIAVDAAGNIYIADEYNHRIRKVDVSGIISTFAGNGTMGYSGDGGPATAARLSNPKDVAFDAAGNLHIADGENYCVRKVDAAGIITTVAGKDVWGYSGDGGPATAAEMSFTGGIAFDGLNNLYIADQFNHCIRKVNPAGIITTIAGDGISGFAGDLGPATNARMNCPADVAVSNTGMIYIADMYNSRIRRIDLSGNISTVGGTGTAGYSGDGGPATLANIDRPVSVLADAAGNIYFSDVYVNRVRKINTSNIITAAAGDGFSGYNGDGGPATTARLSQPWGLAFGTTGNIYIADSKNQRIRELSTTGTITTVAGVKYLGDGGPATNAALYGINDLCIDPSGNIYVSDYYNNCVRKIDPAGVITTIAGYGPSGYSGDGGPATNARLNGPLGVTTDLSGNLYIADASNARVRKVNSAGIITTVAGSGSPLFFSGDGGPATDAAIVTHYLATDAAGNLYLSESSTASRIRKVNTSGIITTIAGTGVWGHSGDGGPATNAQFMTVGGLSVDGSGNLFVTDFMNHVVRKIDNTGIITTVAGDATGVTGYSGDGGSATAAKMNMPFSVSALNSGHLLIADYLNNSIRMVDPAGIITTIAGEATPGYSGDGGPATAAKLTIPLAAKVDGAGNIYIADAGNNVIRKISAFLPPPPPTTRVPAPGNNSMLTPNPVINDFMIVSGHIINSIVIVSSNGKVVLSKACNSKNVQVNISTLQSGMYTVIINGSEIQKIVKL